MFAVSLREAATRLSPELAFLVARHLVYYRPEPPTCFLFYPTLAELTALVLAAVKVARPELPALPISPLSVRLRRELAKYVTETQKTALAIATVEQLDARGGKLDLAAWLHGVELTANRAGLLLAGDLAVALATARGETRTTADLTFEDRRAELLAFTASRASPRGAARPARGRGESVSSLRRRRARGCCTPS